jgi:predicted AlkP superfamily pyrophosphatase or phosphodiesterase
LDGESIRGRYGLDLLLIHPMDLDYAGHRFGSKSKEYESKTVEMDVLLANFIPLWVSNGYGVIVTSDHGMSELGNHGGNRSSLRDTFAYFVNLGTADDCEYSQLSLAPTVCRILGLNIPDSMNKEYIPLE